MKRLTLADLRDVLDQYLTGRQPFSSVRRFVYQYYEAEDHIVLDKDLEALFPILRPYLEDEEAIGDPSRDERVRRVRAMLDRKVAIPEGVVFGQEFNEIRDLTRKLRNQLISHEVFERKVREVSPATFDSRRVVLWALAHADEPEPDPAKMS